MKKFYKDEDDADEDEEAGAEKVQGAKEVEEGLGELGGNQEEAVGGGESVAPPLLSSVFDEQTATESEQNDPVIDASEGSAALVKDNVAECVELGEDAHKLETAEVTSEKPVAFADEEPSNEATALKEPRTGENTEAGAAVENSETLKLVLEDTAVVEALDDTVEENKVDDEKKKSKEGKTEEEEESLKLVLEPDTPIEEEEEIILSSQVD